MVHGLLLGVPTNFVATSFGRFSYEGDFLGAHCERISYALATRLDLFTRIGEKSLEMVQICTMIPNGFMSRDHHGNHDGCHHSTAFGQRRRRFSVRLWVMTR